MNKHLFLRNELSFGKEGMKKLAKSRVCILGIGGVGSHAAEALARSGVGTLVLVDGDVIDITNINRQLHALHSTLGQEKAKVMAERIKDINPNCNVSTKNLFFDRNAVDLFFDQPFDFIIDASDTISYKILLIEECLKRDIPFISSMGAANKIDPTKFFIDDLSRTQTDPMSKIVRRKLKQLGIFGAIPVVYSKEKPQKIDYDVEDSSKVIRKQEMPPSSNPFVPGTVGYILASYVVRKIIGL